MCLPEYQVFWQLLMELWTKTNDMTFHKLIEMIFKAKINASVCCLPIIFLLVFFHPWSLSYITLSVIYLMNNALSCFYAGCVKKNITKNFLSYSITDNNNCFNVTTGFSNTVEHLHWKWTSHLPKLVSVQDLFYCKAKSFSVCGKKNNVMLRSLIPLNNCNILI